AEAAVHAVRHQLGGRRLVIVEGAWATGWDVRVGGAIVAACTGGTGDGFSHLDPSDETAGRQHPVRVELLLHAAHEVQAPHWSPDVDGLLHLDGRIEDDDGAAEL